MATRSEIFVTEQFSHLIRTRPVLWDVSYEEYCDKTKIQDALLEVCTEMYEGLDKCNRNRNVFKTVIHLPSYNKNGRRKDPKNRF